MKIGIIGDPHFGSSYHFGHTLDNNLNSRLKDYTKTLRFAIDHSASVGAKVMAIAGDLFKNCRPGTVEQDAFWSELERGHSEYDMVFYIVAGNHDMPSYCRKTVQSIATKLNQYNYVISCDHICSADFPEEDTSLVLIPYFSRVTEKADTNKEILDFIQRELEASETMSHTIAVWHGLSEGTYLADYTGMEVDALAEPVIPVSLSSRFNVCAFGHVHRFTKILESESSTVVNLGSMDVNDFSDSAQDKYMMIVDTAEKNEHGGPVKVEYVKLPVVKAETIKVKLSGSISIDAKNKIKEKQVKGRIVRVHIPADDETTSTFNDSEMRELIESLGAYKYMGTVFKASGEPDTAHEVDLSCNGDVTLDFVRKFLLNNNMELIDETISYAKDIILRIDGDVE